MILLLLSALIGGAALIYTRAMVRAVESIQTHRDMEVDELERFYD